MKPVISFFKILCFPGNFYCALVLIGITYYSLIQISFSIYEPYILHLLSFLTL